MLTRKNPKTSNEPAKMARLFNSRFGSNNAALLLVVVTLAVADALALVLKSTV